MRRNIIGVGGIAAGLAILLAGCSGGSTAGQPTVPSSIPTGAPSSSASSPSSAGAAGAQSVTWMNSLCGELAGLAGLGSIQPPDIKPGDVEGAHKALSDVLGKFESSLTSLVRGLKELPPAPDPAGDKVKQDLLDIFVPVKEKAVKIKDNLDASEPSDKQAMMDAVKGMQSIGSSLQSMDNPLKQLKGTELVAAGKQARNCKKLGSFGGN